MSERNDFLFEMLTEELPPLALQKLSASLVDGVKAGLEKAELSFNSIHAYATPRRLAFIVKDLIEQQADRIIERKGPGVNVAYDDQGKPTPAALGFARSCGVEFEQVQTLKTDKGEWLFCKVEQTGDSAASLLPEIIKASLKQLPIPKLMTWGKGDHQFARPVHNVLALFGDECIDLNLFGHQACNYTVGHRFHHPQKITIEKPNQYSEKLREAYVVVDFETRRQQIVEQIKTVADSLNANAIASDALIDEVTALVEWPVAVTGNYDSRYLSIPEEVLILVMETHQRYFGLRDNEGKLLPQFITISNIASQNQDQVADGNQRVLHARFADAEFFYEADRTQKLEDRVGALHNVTFQKQLGSLYDKTERVAKLSLFIADLLNADKTKVARTAELAKTDLLTEMVGEFPELQGIMGYYYALHDKEDLSVATALKEQYQPRFAGDELPTQLVSQCLAIAERIDTIVGIIGIGKIPTGEKDPYALRRAALGVLRIIVERQLPLDLNALLEFSCQLYDDAIANKKICLQTLAFMQDRLRFWLQQQGIPANVITAVANVDVVKPDDFKNRVDALLEFIKQPDYQQLVAINKRVANILKKADSADTTIDETLLNSAIEKKLATIIEQKQQQLNDLQKQLNYSAMLTELADTQTILAQFFEEVMVFVDDEKLRNNRIALLTRLRNLFLLVADISELQG